MRATLALLIVLFALPALAQDLAWTSNPRTPGYREALAKMFPPGDIQPEPGEFEIALADLNGDERDEIFARVTSFAYCGSAGCSYAAYVRERRGLREVLNVLGNGIRLGPPPRRGEWRALIVDDSVWSYDARARAYDLDDGLSASDLVGFVGETPPWTNDPRSLYYPEMFETLRPGYPTDYDVEIAVVDLNGDGRDEVLGRMLRPCPRPGCPHVVFTNVGNGLQEIADELLIDGEVLIDTGPPVGGWRSLVIGGGRLVWSPRTGRYEVEIAR